METSKVICTKCNTEMKSVSITAATGGVLHICDFTKKLFSQRDSMAQAYVCPECGYIELYAEKPEIFK